jgi:phosphotransferase system HPr (HPr) family protein
MVVPVFSQAVPIVNHSGLHARAAAKVSKVADQFQATVWIKKGDQLASLDSILDLMMLMANQGDTVIIEATGSEAEAALTAVSKLIENGFGEKI